MICRALASPPVNRTEERDYTEYVTAKLPWLRKVAYLLCQDWHQADDVCQAALTRLYVHWRKASQASHVDGYVRTIVVRTFLAQRRSTWARHDANGSYPGSAGRS